MAARSIFTPSRGRGGAHIRTLIPPTFARATVMVTLLATEVGLEESFGTLRVTLARR